MKREYDTPLETPISLLDAGANIGLAAVYFANRFPGLHIIAVEPEDENFKTLLINTRRYKNITCLNAAVWPCVETLKVENRDAKSWAFRMAKHDGDHEANRISAINIDMIAKRWNGGTPFELIKMDIEGAEKEVFAAGGKWLEAAHAIIVECHDRLVEGCESTVMEAIAPFHFSTRRSGEYLVIERQKGISSI